MRRKRARILARYADEADRSALTDQRRQQLAPIASRPRDVPERNRIGGVKRQQFRIRDMDGFATPDRLAPEESIDRQRRHCPKKVVPGRAGRRKRDQPRFIIGKLPHRGRMPTQQTVVRSAIASNTGWISVGELAITFRTSAVAVW